MAPLDGLDPFSRPRRSRRGGSRNRRFSACCRRRRRLDLGRDPEAQALFRSAPGLVNTIVADAGLASSGALWLKLASTPFDIAIDGRDGLIGRITARQRLALQPGAMVQHRTEAWA